MKQNVQLKSEVAQWKSNCFRKQQGIPEVKPNPRQNNPYYYYTRILRWFKWMILVFPKSILVARNLSSIVKSALRKHVFL